MTARPLVSIGIPTYNRPALLERAVRSVLAQDMNHGELEVVVADDASPDGRTPELCARLAGEDSRVRVVRHPQNLGHDANYDAVRELARGEHFMWLSDDDWIEPGYVSRCLEALHADPRTILACGQAVYHRRDGSTIEERPIDLRERRPGVRLMRFFARVSMNGPLFGVMRREDVPPFPRVPGGDWLLVAGLAARGRVRTLRDVHIHRSDSGLGSDPEALGRSFGLSGFCARHHHVCVAREVARTLPASGAVRVACAALIVARFEGTALARRAGLGFLEPRIAEWLRAREST